MEPQPGSSNTPQRRAYTCRLEREHDLVEELRRALPASKHFSPEPGLVESLVAPDEQGKVVSVAFAGQCLHNPQDVAATSVSQWARLVLDKVTADMGDQQVPWRLHLFGQEVAGKSFRRVRLQHIEEVLAEHLHKELRCPGRLRVMDPAAPWAPEERLFQLVLTTNTRGLFSVMHPADRTVLRRMVSRFPGGEFNVPDILNTPSRAYKKLLEAEAHLGRTLKSGEVAVDLGASPGGWTCVALQRGARVTAVDRSPLREDLMGHPQLTFVKGDAFAWKPASQVDWLLCDVISFPVRTLELLKTWLSRRWCRRFVVSVKFKGVEEYPRLEEVKRICKQNTWDFCIRQLPTNRNEVTAMGECTRPQDPA